MIPFSTLCANLLLVTGGRVLIGEGDVDWVRERALISFFGINIRY